jgi:hypothetical protein
MLWVIFVTSLFPDILSVIILEIFVQVFVKGDYHLTEQSLNKQITLNKVGLIQLVKALIRKN